ncbi:MAG: 50S ribosomal protein L44e [Candidatus Diapherotrites archaeon]
MDIPKTSMDYCKKCNKHIEHKRKLFKPGKARADSEGTRKNVRKKKGYGGKYQFTAVVKKQNKKPVFIMECTACKSKHYNVIPKRMKKIEIKAAA